MPETVVWSDAQAALPPQILVRTPWDYFEKPDAFTRFLQTPGVEFFNPATLMTWNLDKTYLRQLGDAGVPVVPTVFIPQGQSELSLLEKVRWPEFVIKPTISAGAHLTERVAASGRELALPVAAQILKDGDLMAQPFCAEVLDKGELSLIYFHDRTAWGYSHSILKKVKAGDFRVQEKFGGSIEKHHPSAEAFAVAEQALNALPEPGLYARVDLIPYEGKWVVAEMELVEPELFFRFDNAAPKRLCNALLNWY